MVVWGRWLEKVLSFHYLPTRPLEGRNVPKD
jgi:hypothetical protein